MLEFLRKQEKLFEKSLRESEIALDSAVTKKDKKRFLVRCDGLRSELGAMREKIKREVE